MRLQIRLRAEPGSILPRNHQYQLAGFIYRALQETAPEFSNWFHDIGFSHGHNRFKFFVFSPLSIPEKEIAQDRLFVLADHCNVELSFVSPILGEHLEKALPRGKSFAIGDRFSKAFFEIEGLSTSPLPDFREEMRYELSSGILVKKTNSIKGSPPSFLSPEHPGFVKGVSQNLGQKLLALAENIPPESSFWESSSLQLSSEVIRAVPATTMTILSNVETEFVRLKYSCPSRKMLPAKKFQFSLRTHPVLHRLGFLSGFGSNNSMGFGFVKVAPPTFRL